jgi:hypothetical protein
MSNITSNVTITLPLVSSKPISLVAIDAFRYAWIIIALVSVVLYILFIIGIGKY